MFRKDKYRLFAIISFIILVLCLIVLFITLWNNFSLNLEVPVGNIVYLYLLIILAAAITIIVIYMFHTSEVHSVQMSLQETPVGDTVNETSKSVEQEADPVSSPYNINIDELATFIIPKMDFREHTEDFAERILQNLAKQFEVVQGVLYLKNENTPDFQAITTYAWASEKSPAPFVAGEGLTGQVAKNKTIMRVDNIPDNYIKIQSGLGSGTPRHLLIVPLLLNKETVGIIELASFREFDKQTEWIFKNLTKIIANSLITKIKAGRAKK